jgi:glutamate-1-semialdehyde 2,1-aminomutase
MSPRTTILSRFEVLHPGSAKLAARASSIFPNGVTHDMRHNVPFPLYVQSASGSRKRDVDGNEIIDYVMGHGALLLGHNHPEIVAAVQAQLQRGTHYGASHELEIKWGECVRQLIPSAERVRFTSSGTEATMMALRLARAFTGRQKVLRLNEHFHGWNDAVTGQPSPEATLPQSPGIPSGLLESGIVLPQNDLPMLERTMADHGSEIAAAILEPTGAHWGTEPIDVEYVRRLRELTAQHGIVLIFDEVITGFRMSEGGAQKVYGILPDMTTMAKIVAGGLPGACVAGRAEILEQIAIGRGPADARIAHPGTFNANPLSSAAGSTCLSLIADGQAQRTASATAERIAQELNRTLRDEAVPGCVYGHASMLHIALGMSEQPADGYTFGPNPLPCPAPHADPDASHALRLSMLNEGIDLMAGGLMVSTAHTPDDEERTVAAFRTSLRAMKAEGLLH